jgi:rubrerythrin
LIGDPQTLDQLERIIAEEKKHIQHFRELLSGT